MPKIFDEICVCLIIYLFNNVFIYSSQSCRDVAHNHISVNAEVYPSCLIFSSSPWAHGMTVTQLVHQATV